MFRTVLFAVAILLSTTTIGAAQETSTQSATPEAQSEEALAWESVKDSDASADVFAFIERFPDGAFTKEAQALMIDLLWAEMAATGPAAEPEPEGTDGQLSVVVTFNEPLTVGDPEVVGRSLKELIEGRPLFPPVEGLPESYWKTETCSSCHEWEPANLCDQAKTYLSEAGAENLTKKHPYGGSFKQNLRSWAISGCE